MNARILALGVASLLAASPLFAATDTWDGGGGDNYISTNFNWADNTAPVSDLANTDLIFAGTTRPAPNFSSPFSARSIGFDFIFPGTFTLGGSAITIGVNGIYNNSANTQTFNNPVIVGSATTSFGSGLGGALAFNNTVDVGTNALSVLGTYSTSFANFTGTGSVTKSGGGTMTWAPTAATSADIIVNAGTLSTVADGSTDILNGSASIAVNGTSTLNINENLILSLGAQLTGQATATVRLASTKTLTVASGSHFSGENSSGFSGNITVYGAGSTFSTASTFYVSNGHTLDVEAGGSFLGGFQSAVRVGGAALGVPSDGTAMVSGIGSNVSADFLGIGVNGGNATVTFNEGSTGAFEQINAFLEDAYYGTSHPTLNVQSGASVTVGSYLAVGDNSFAPGNATITITGAGSALTQTGAGDTNVGSYGDGGGTGTLNVLNGGTFTSGTATVELKITGTINIDGGTVNLRGQLYTEGVLNFTRGSLSIVDNFTVGTGGLFGLNYTVDSLHHFATSATTTIDAFRTLTIDGGSFSTGALVNNGTLAFNKGTLGITGAAGFNIGTGALGSSVTLGAGANLAVTNTTTVASGALLRVNGGSFSGGSITNNGTIDHQDGALGFTGTLNNNAAGRMFVGGLSSSLGQIDNAGRITLQNGLGYLGGAGAITNTGLITGDGTIAKPLTNSATGQVRAEAGKTLTFTGTVTPNAGTFSLQGGTLEFTTAITNASGGFISGQGTLLSAGLTNQGNIALSGETALHGDVTNAAGARVVTSGGGRTTFYDDVIHNGLEIRTSAGGASVFFGAVSGAGPFTGTGTVYFEGDLRPGNSPAAVGYEGDLVFGGASSLTLEIGGLTEGSQFDHLDVAGTLHADGDLVLALLSGFTPQIGDTFDLFDVGAFAGGFDAFAAPALPGDLAWDFTALASTGVVTVVPEPGIGALLVSGLALLGLRRRRRIH